MQRALELAVTGYPEIPTKRKKEFVSAKSYREAVERLIKKGRKLSPPTIKLTLWDKRKTKRVIRP